MQGSEATNTFENIHFPQRLTVIKNLRRVSFFINDVILLVSCIIFLIWVTNAQALTSFLFANVPIVSQTSLLFIFVGISLLFGARRHLKNKEDAKMDTYPWWNTALPIFFASVTSILGLISRTKIGPVSFGLHLSSIEGFCFFIIGLSLIPPFTRIPHRFHVTQLLVFIVSGVSMFVVLENIYQLFVSIPVQQSISLPFSLALTFAFFCLGVLLRWSNRGFFGNFTLDSTGSIFAFRILLLNLVAAPLIVFMVLLVVPKNSYNLYQTISLIVVVLTFISSLLIWLNLKFLYKYELEHLLMRESLHAHNIDLVSDKEKLEEKMLQIEQESQQYKAKLAVQAGWKNAIDNSE